MGMFSYGFISTQILIIPYFVTFNGIVFRNFIAIKSIDFAMGPFGTLCNDHGSSSVASVQGLVSKSSRELTTSGRFSTFEETFFVRGPDFFARKCLVY